MSEEAHVTLSYTWLDDGCKMEMWATATGETHEDAADKAHAAIDRNKEAVHTYDN